MKDRSGRIWTGMHNGYVTVTDAVSRRMMYLSPDGRLTGVPVRLTDEGVYALREDRYDNVWIGTKAAAYMCCMEAVAETDCALCQELHRQMVAELRQHIRLLRRRRRPYVGGHLWRRHQHCSHEARRQHGIHQRQQRDDAFQGQGLQPHAPHISRPRRNNGGVNVRRHSYHVASCRQVFVDAILLYDAHSGRHHVAACSDVLNTYVSRSSGRIYATTMGGGFQVAQASGLLRDNIPFRRVEGIEHEEGTIQAVVEDAAGNLWLVRESSLDKLYQKTGQYEIYGSNDWEEDIGFTEAQPMCRHVEARFSSVSSVVTCRSAPVR